LNELDDVVDLLRRLGEASDRLVGRLRLGRGGLHHFSRTAELAIDLGDRFRQFVRRGCGAFDAAERFVGRVNRPVRLRRGFVRRCGELGCRRFQCRDAVVDSLEHALDAAAEP
jgi:hypothetical protein